MGQPGNPYPLSQSWPFLVSESLDAQAAGQLFWVEESCGASFSWRPAYGPQNNVLNEQVLVLAEHGPAAPYFERGMHNETLTSGP